MPSFSAFIRDNRVFLAGTGITFAGVSVFLVGRLVLQVWRDENEFKPVQPKTQYITQDTEDSLQLNTLEALLGHHNFLIRETAAKIIFDRAVNDGSTMEILLVGITNPDYDERMKNLRALAIITDPNSLKQLHSWKAYTALVRSLELSLDPDQEPLDNPDWDEYPLRDMTEKLCLMFISQLLGHYTPGLLIKAKFVERWLAKQNWGPEDKRADNYVQYMQQKSNRITEIARIIREDPAGREALFNTGLFHKGRDNDGALVGSAVERYRYMFITQVGASGRARSVERSAEEQRLRHRHREAMVLNDGTRPINSDDIFQRDHGSPS